MALPKRKVSKSKLRMRKRSHRHKVQAVNPCKQCGASHQTHRVCPSCGYYRGRQVMTVQAD